MKKFTELLEQQEFLDYRIDYKTDKRAGYNGSEGWVSVQNSGVKDRNLWCLDSHEKNYWGNQAKGVYRWYVHDDPRNPGSSVIKVDLHTMTVSLLNSDAMENQDKNLIWTPYKYKIKGVTVFNHKFIEDQG